MLIGFNTLCYSLPYTHMVMSVLTQREERCIEYMQYTWAGAFIRGGRLNWLSNL